MFGCGGGATTKPIEIENAERDIRDGLQAFSDAKWGKANRFFSSALSIYEGIDDQQGILFSRINLAEVALSVHNFPVSLNHLDLAANIAKTTSQRPEQARITLLYALVALQQKKIDRAERFIQSLLPEFNGKIPSMVQIAAVAVRTKIAFIQNKDEALWTNRYANTLNVSITYPSDLNFRLLRFKSLLLQQQGKDAEAESRLQQALAGYKTILNRPGIAATLLELGLLYKTQERWQEAQDYFDRSIAVFRYLNDSGKVIQITEQLKEIENYLAH